MSMSKQRLRSPSRRDVLAASGAIVTTASAGCGAPELIAGQPEPAHTTASPTKPVSILSAGSLQNALGNGLRTEVDRPVQIESHGSVTVARLVAAGKRDPDVVAVADVSLFDSMPGSSWHSLFASNAIVVAYNSETEGGRRVGAAGSQHWYEPVLDGTASLGRTDPDLDPLGYRTLFALELAAEYYDVPNLRERLLSERQMYPETSLLSRFESGAIDVAITYRNMAIDHDYEYVDLPDEIDLSTPAYADRTYNTVSYTLPNGQTLTGGPIYYGTTVRHMQSPVIDVFRTLVSGDYLEGAGFVVPDGFPEYKGSVPDAIDN